MKDKQNIRRKILKCKYPGFRMRKLRNHIYDEFHTYDLVDQMRRAEQDHRVLRRDYNAIMQEAL